MLGQTLPHLNTKVLTHKEDCGQRCISLCCICKNEVHFIFTTQLSCFPKNLLLPHTVRKPCMSQGQLCFSKLLSDLYFFLSHPLLSIIFQCHSQNNSDSLIFKGFGEVTSTVTVDLLMLSLAPLYSNDC